MLMEVQKSMRGTKHVNGTASVSVILYLNDLVNIGQVNVVAFPISSWVGVRERGRSQQFASTPRGGSVY